MRSPVLILHETPRRFAWGTNPHMEEMAAGGAYTQTHCGPGPNRRRHCGIAI